MSKLLNMKEDKSSCFTKNRYLFYIIFVFVFMTPFSAVSAVIDPSFRFSTIETERFTIHFHQGLDEVANKAALISEEAHSKLSSAFQWVPWEKTHIVLLDNTDFANGLARVLPYNAVYIYVAPPLPDMSIGEYENWLEIVITHEYAHILTMDPVRGYSSVMRGIFGKPALIYDPLSAFLFLFTAPPNVFMPYWWIEGIATWAETEFSSSGRGRGSFYEMFLRMAVLEERIPGIDRLNGEAPYWPSRRIRYIYGMMIEKYIAQKYGKETPGALNIAHAGRVPFFINGPPKRFTGRNYKYLYRDMVEELKKEQTRKIQYLRSMPLTEFIALPLDGEILTNPRFSPDGRYIAVNRRDPHSHEAVVIFDTDNHKEISTIRRLPSDHGISWSPDGQRLYFTQADLRGGFNLYQDIYSYDLADGSVERLTESLRAKDIDVSPDGRYIVFVKVEASRQSLVVLSLNKKDNIEVIVGPDEPALSVPGWSPDGKFIVFSKRSTGQTSIEHYNVNAKTTETLLKDTHNNIFPTWSSDGSFIIFTSDRTGVYNLFAYSPDSGQTWQITHVLGGAFQADVSGNNKIVFSSYHSRGFNIVEIPYEPSKWFKNLSPAIGPVWSDSEGDSPRESPLWKRGARGGVKGGMGGLSDKKRHEEGTVAVSEKRDYSAVPTLLPKFWLPTLSSDYGGAVFGAFTAGQDVLGYHTYLLQAGYGISNQAYFDTRYIYNRWRPSFYIRGYSLPVLYSNFFNDGGSYYERRSGLAAGISIPINSLESRYSMIAGYHAEKMQRLTAIRGRTRNGLDVYEGRRDNVFAGIEYKSALKYPYSISREEGRNISMLYKNYSQKSGSGLNKREYSADYDEFIGVGRHHVVYLNLRGATSDGDLIAQQAYQLGGIPPIGSNYPLRGFAPGFETGSSVVRGTLEYRFPAKYIFRGWSTRPVFIDRLSLALFTDAGNVWGYKKRFDWNDFEVGMGAEARLNMALGYKLRITPAIGIAQGIAGGGETQVYFTIYTDL